MCTGQVTSQELFRAANYDKAMRVVAYAELAIFIRVVLGALLFKNSFTAPLIYAHFIRQRYVQSAFTRDAIAVTDARILDLARRTGNPVVEDVWGRVTDAIRRWGAFPGQGGGDATRRD